MIWVALIIGILAMIVTLSGVILSALIISRSASDSNRLVATMHDRSVRQQNNLLDRLMTVKWENLVDLETARSADTEWGGQVFSDEGLLEDEDEPDQVVQDVWDRMRSISGDTTPDEQALIDEDFDDEEVKVPS